MRDRQELTDFVLFLSLPPLVSPLPLSVEIKELTESHLELPKSPAVHARRERRKEHDSRVGKANNNLFSPSVHSRAGGLSAQYFFVVVVFVTAGWADGL